MPGNVSLPLSRKAPAHAAIAFNAGQITIYKRLDCKSFILFNYSWLSPLLPGLSMQFFSLPRDKFPSPCVLLALLALSVSDLKKPRDKYQLLSDEWDFRLYLF